MVQLQGIWILNTETFSTNRLKGCPIASDKELKYEGCVSYDYRSDVNLGVCVVKWYDNKSVHLVSTFFGVAAAGIAKQWYAKEKSYIDVSLSEIVLDYSTSMGGVELAC